MSLDNPKERAHALLGASSAHRWLSCPPSARLAEQYPVKDTVYTEEGTLAHSVAELYLKKDLGRIEEKEYKKLLKDLKTHTLFVKEMISGAEDYVRIIQELRMTLPEHSYLAIEQRSDYGAYAKEGFGTADCVMIGANTLIIVDYKFGKGKLVEAKGNEQLRLYALGIYEAAKDFYAIETVKMVIVQPRLGHFDEDEITLAELLAFGEYVKQIAPLAYEGEGHFEPSKKACSFCPHSANCEARQEQALKDVRQIFDVAKKENPSKESLADALHKYKELASWAKETEALLKKEILSGECIQGWKVVEGRSIRTITDETKVAHILMDTLGYPEALVYRKSLETLTNLSKLVGAKEFEKYCGEYIEKPRGQPTLVPESDKRKPYEVQEDIRAIFKETDLN